MQIDGQFTFTTPFDDHLVDWSDGTLICKDAKITRQINNYRMKWGSGKYFFSAEREIIAFVRELEIYAAQDFVSATWIDKPEVEPIERVEGRIY